MSDRLSDKNDCSHKSSRKKTDLSDKSGKKLLLGKAGFRAVVRHMSDICPTICPTNGTFSAYGVSFFSGQRGYSRGAVTEATTGAEGAEGNEGTPEAQ